MSCVSILHYLENHYLTLAKAYELNPNVAQTFQYWVIRMLRSRIVDRQNQNILFQNIEKLWSICPISS